MSITNNLFPESKKFVACKKEQLRKLYLKPELEELGDLRSLTLGASPEGFPDSGGGSVFEDFPDAMPPIPPPIQ